MSEQACRCGQAPAAAATVIFACSGASDVGEVSDRAARRLAREGFGKMSCLAGIAGRVGSIMDAAGAASAVVAIDGCTRNCAMRTLARAGIVGFRHVRLHDLGLQKGQTPATDETVGRVADGVKAMLSR